MPTKRKSKSTKGKSVRESKDVFSFFVRLKNSMTYAPALVVFMLVIFLVLDYTLNIGEPLRSDNTTTVANGDIYDPNAPLADFFTSSIQYWEPAIYNWAQEAQINPNLVATIMQIESCGNPYVSSYVGAQGLMQVMPANFQDGDNQLDLNTNVRTGLSIFRQCLQFSTDPNFDGVTDQAPDVGLALVCYNGGPSLIGLPQSQWYDESKAYYQWGTGIWRDASQGSATSSTLDAWLNAGGSGLCNQAYEVQETYKPIESLIR